MSKYDTLFEKIITNEELSEELGTNIGRYKTIEEAKKAVSNKKLKAIAEIISEVGKRYELKKANSNILAKDVTIDDSEFQSIYRKVVSLLTK